MNSDERKAVEVLHKVIDFIPFSSYSKKTVGSLIKRLSSEDREKLKSLKSSNIQDRIYLSRRK